MVNGKLVKNTETENILLKVVMFMMVIGLIIKEME